MSKITPHVRRRRRGRSLAARKRRQHRLRDSHELVVFAPARREHDARSGEVLSHELSQSVARDVTQIPARRHEGVPQAPRVRRRVRRLHQQRLWVLVQLLHLGLQILHHSFDLVILQRRIQRAIEQQFHRLRRARLERVRREAKLFPARARAQIRPDRLALSRHPEPTSMFRRPERRALQRVRESALPRRVLARAPAVHVRPARQRRSRRVLARDRRPVREHRHRRRRRRRRARLRRRVVRVRLAHRRERRRLAARPEDRGERAVRRLRVRARSTERGFRRRRVRASQRAVFRAAKHGRRPRASRSRAIAIAIGRARFSSRGQTVRDGRSFGHSVSDRVHVQSHGVRMRRVRRARSYCDGTRHHVSTRSVDECRHVATRVDASIGARARLEVAATRSVVQDARRRPRARPRARPRRRARRRRLRIWNSNVDGS